MTYALGTKQLELLQIAFGDAVASTSTYGRFARAYELLFAMISSGTGVPAVSENDLSGMDTNALTSFYTGWKTTGLDSINISDWDNIDEINIDNGAWVFLRGVSDVNWGPENPAGYETNYSLFIREYTKIQYETRFGIHHKRRR